MPVAQEFLKRLDHDTAGLKVTYRDPMCGTQSGSQREPSMPLKKEDVTAALRKSDGNMKFAKYSAGESLYLMVRNGRGYWRVQYRDGQSFKAKVLGTAPDLSPTEAGHERDAF